jgi:hypothetical protein
MDYTWGNHPNSPYYEPNEDEILESLYGIDMREYYALQNKCEERLKLIERGRSNANTRLIEPKEVVQRREG